MAGHCARRARNWSVDQLGEIALPYLEQPTQTIGEGSNVATWLDGKVRIACKQETSGPARVVQDMGAERPEIDDEGQHEGLRFIAMPVFSYTGQVIVSMCVVGPKQKLQVVRTLLAAQARALSEHVGHGGAAA